MPARHSPADPRPSRFLTPISCSARRPSHPGPRVTRPCSSVWGASGGRTDLLEGPGRVHHRAGYAGGFTPTPATRRYAPGAPGTTRWRWSFRPGEGAFETLLRRSGRTTTPRRACAREMTSAPSTGPASTHHRRATRGGQAVEGPVPGAAGRLRVRRYHHRDPRAGPFFYAEAYHQQYLAKTRMGIATTASARSAYSSPEPRNSRLRTVADEVERRRRTWDGHSPPRSVSDGMVVRPSSPLQEIGASGVTHSSAPLPTRKPTMTFSAVWSRRLHDPPSPSSFSSPLSCSPPVAVKREQRPGEPSARPGPPARPRISEWRPPQKAKPRQLRSRL